MIHTLKHFATAACLFFFIFSGCQEDPVSLPPKACLLADKNYPLENEAVTFTDCSEDAFRIEIDFGDGTFAKSAPVQHSYSEEGTYFATLTAWSEYGDIKSESRQKIMVGADTTVTPTNTKPTACFTPSTSMAEVGNDILFLNCSLNASSFSWNFGDGTSSTAQNPTHAFTGSGTFHITLTVTNVFGSDDTTISVIVGTRVLANVILNNFSPTNPSGNAWDDLGFPIPGIPVEPDVYVELSSTSGSSLETDIKNNLATTALPVNWDVSAENLTLTNENWTVIIYDNEGFFQSPEEMFRWNNVNLGTLGGNGVITLSSGSYSVVLQYSIK